MKKLLLLATGCWLASAVASAANDPGSFGRPVRYLDVGLSATYVYVTSPTFCQQLPVGTRCVVLASTASLVNISEPNIAKIDLPANATNSLLCFSVSPTINLSALNSTTSNVIAFLTLQTDATLESVALANPSLINRTTGQPFGGRIVYTNLSRYMERFTLAPNTVVGKTSQDSRDCVMGLISLDTLQSRYGLTAAQAHAVFASPLTVTLATAASTQNTSLVMWSVGFRLFGD